MISKKRKSLVLIPFLLLMAIPIVKATTITSCTFDKESYNQGETGFISVSITNDQEYKIRITELTATINYYYYDGRAFNQKFETNDSLPAEIQQEKSIILNIPFDLPEYIASGYTSVYVKTISEIYNSESLNWRASEHSTFQPILSIESPYKEQLEGLSTINDQLEKQLLEQQASKETATTMMLMFGITTTIFAVITVILLIMNRRSKGFSRSIFYPE